MWIYVPVETDTDDKDGPEPWVGRIEISGLPKEPWKFEAVRHSDLSDVYDAKPFADAPTVVGLLDHQRRCTIVRPFVSNVDPGSIGNGLFSRTVIKGEFQALVNGLPFPDPTVPMIDSLSFDSQSFAAWFAAAAFKKDYDFDSKKSSMEILDTKRETVLLSTGESIEVALGAEVKSRGSTASVRTASFFGVKFAKPISLDEAIEVAGGLEYLFGFLIGFRRKFPVFTISTSEHRATIELGGWNWKSEELPDHFWPLHARGLGAADLKTVLDRFLADRLSFVTRIHAVEFSRFFSNNLNDRFTVVMPALEQYLLARFKVGAERSYEELKGEFFNWVESSPNKDLIEYCKKHVRIVQEKSPGLSTLIERAIDDVNASGFAFPRALAKQIQKRRGSVFHSVPSMSADDARQFYIEVRAATGLLMLLTLKDLGIDIAALADRYFALWDLQGFLVPREKIAADLQPASSGVSK